MPIHGAAMSLMLKKGHDRRREDELWKAFTDADVNGDGYLSVEEYVRVFHNHGITISREEVCGDDSAQLDTVVLLEDKKISLEFD